MAQEENKSDTSGDEDTTNHLASEQNDSVTKPQTPEQEALDKALAEIGEEAQEEGKEKKKRRFIIIGLVVAVGIFFWWYMHRNEEETDDAYVTGRKVAIAPHVSGYVYELLVNDNQFVHKGDVLIRVDGRDYITQLHNAQGQLAQAQANFNAAVLSAEVAKKNFPGQLMSAQGEVADAQANLFKAQTDYARQHRVLRAATSQADIDASTAQLESAEAKLAEAKGHLIQAQPVNARVKTSQMQVVQGDAQIKSALAALEKAKLDVGWLTVRAPCDGWVSQRTVERGNFVQAGQHILSIVPKDLWVVANYKETQLKKMRAGQAVEIHVDAYPQLHLKGHVDSFQMGTGESFSTFPPENATGNFVKVVQRVPVKILIDKGLKEDLPLALGLSLVTVVDVGHTPHNPPPVRAPKEGAGDGSLNIEEMAEKALSFSNVKKMEGKSGKEPAPKPFDMVSPSASSPFNSSQADKNLDQEIASVDQGKKSSSLVNRAGDLAERQGKEEIADEAQAVGRLLSKDLPPAPPPKANAQTSKLSPAIPQADKGQDIPSQALAKLAQLGISKEALRDRFEEKNVNEESNNHDPVQIRDPNTQAALGRMAKEALEGIKTLPISPEKKAEIERTVHEIARKNAIAWKLSPADKQIVQNAVKQAALGGDRKYPIDPELEKELVKAATSRNGKIKKAHTGKAAEDEVSSDTSQKDNGPGSSVNNKQNAPSYGMDTPKLNFQNSGTNMNNNDGGLMPGTHTDFETGTVKTEGNALGGNPLGSGIR